ncbi:PhzF family phenazine biosynthesis protein [Tistrella bauzanensis]
MTGLTGHAGGPRLYRAFCAEDGHGGNPAWTLIAAPDHDHNHDHDHDHDPTALARAAATASATGIEVTLLTPGDGGSWRAVFMVPGGRLSLCLHGLIAAAARLWQDGAAPRAPLVIDTDAGPQHLTPVIHDGAITGAVCRLDGNHHRPCADAEATAIIARAAAATGLAPDRFRHSPARAGAARPKLVLRIDDPHLIGQMSPDAAMVDALGRDTGTTGLYVYAHAGPAAGIHAGPAGTASLIRARHFPAGIGLVEDIATGGSAPVAGLDLLHHRQVSGPPHLIIAQGPDGPDGRGMARIETWRDGDHARPGRWMVAGRISAGTSG